MHEHDKIEEAEYFLERMIAVVGHGPHSRFNLSAFLSAARSALQYALKEAKGNPQGQEWYNRHVAKYREVTFLRNQRNINIHTEPVRTPMVVSVNLASVLCIASNGNVGKTDKDGCMVQETAITPSSPPTSEQKNPEAAQTRHYFSDWAGKEDVLTVCHSYLAQIQQIVADGVAKGFLTP